MFVVSSILMIPSAFNSGGIDLALIMSALGSYSSRYFLVRSIQTLKSFSVNESIYFRPVSIWLFQPRNVAMIGKMKTQKKTAPQSNVISPNIFRPVFVEDFMLVLPQFLGLLCCSADGAHHSGAELAFFQFVQAFNRRAAGTGHLVFERTGMLAGGQNHLRAA